MNNKVIRNAGWIIGCKLAKAGLTLLVTILTARYLGVSNYGLINYAAGIVAFVAPIMKLGLDSTIVFELVNKPEKEGETLGTVISLSFISSLVCIGGVLAFTSIANHGEIETLVVCGLYSTLLIFQALEMIQYWFQAKLMAKYSSIAMLIAYLVVTIVQTLLIINKSSVYWFALSHSIDYLIISLILFIVYFRKKGQKLTFSSRTAKALLKVSHFYIVSSLMVTIFNNTDRIMLKLMVGNEATGIYSAAHTCASMTSFVFVAIIDSMRPTIFEYKNKDRDQFKKSLIGLYSVIIYFSLVQCMGLSIFSSVIIKVIYGSKFMDAATVLCFSVWFTTFSYLGIVRNIWILSENLQKYLWKINMAGALMNVILNWIMIPLWGATGAAIASVISQFFTNVVVGYIIRPIRPNNALMVEALNPVYLITYTKKVLGMIKTRFFNK